jgi:hypothetical protein
MMGPFAEGATVKDEGQERRGLPAIRKWMEESNAKYLKRLLSWWPFSYPIGQLRFMGASM